MFKSYFFKNNFCEILDSAINELPAQNRESMEIRDENR